MNYILLFVFFAKIFRSRYNCLNIFLKQLIEREDYQDRTELIINVNQTTTMFRKITEYVIELNNLFGLFQFVLIFYFLLKNIYWISIVTNKEILETNPPKLLLLPFAGFYVVSITI